MTEKRKRNDQGGGRPTKKAAVAQRVAVELLKNEALGPLLGASCLFTATPC
jgi:hypothetical protein